MKNRGGGRLLRSTLNKALAIGACSALLATGALVVAASPAGAATATKLGFTTEPSGTTNAGAVLSTFDVTVEDGTGALATTGLTDMIAITSSCGLTGTLSVAAGAGVAVFSAVTINTGVSCTLLATDTSENETTAMSTAVVVTPGAVAKVGFNTEPPAATTSGVAVTTFTVATEDTYGNVVTTGADAADVIAITSACTLAGTATATAGGGVASFGALIIDAGTSPCTLTATDTSHTLTTGTSSAIAINGGTPTKVVFTTQPPATVVQSAVLAPFKVSVEDVYGNTDLTGTGSTDTVTITPSAGCTIGGTASAVGAAGVATFAALTITSTGSCGLTATDSSRVLTTALSTAVDSQGPQAALTVSSINGYLGVPLTLTTAGGSGTGADTFVATVGTAGGCVVTGTTLSVTSIGTCIVTATKAASTTNLAATSVATTVTFVVPGPMPSRVIGFVTAGKTKTITIVGKFFAGRPRITSHAGTTALVTQDIGRLQRVKVTVKAGSRNGTFTFTITNANGLSGKIKYVQHA
ncbi:MAG: hypothetical protein WA786_05355 [Acidimicrobiales bacterium]